MRIIAKTILTTDRTSLGARNSTSRSHLSENAMKFAVSVRPSVLIYHVLCVVLQQHVVNATLLVLHKLNTFVLSAFHQV